jgi:hypothetical protein
MSDTDEKPDADDKPDQGQTRWGQPAHHRRRDTGGLFFGGLLLIVGGYFLLTETFGLNLPEIGQFWPVFVILLGLWILASSMRSGRG